MLFRSSPFGPADLREVRGPVAAPDMAARVCEGLRQHHRVTPQRDPILSQPAHRHGKRRRREVRDPATNPRFILLDEPFAGVDPIAVIDIQKIIRYLKESGIGVLITDHNVRETLGICDRATIINAGEVLAAGQPAEIVDNESVRRVYLGEHFRM